MKKISFLFLFSATVLLASCDYQKNNTIDQIDVNAENERVYGDGPDAPARQLEQQYETTPEEAARASALLEKLHGE